MLLTYRIVKNKLKTILTEIRFFIPYSDVESSTTVDIKTCVNAIDEWSCLTHTSRSLVLLYLSQTSKHLWLNSFKCFFSCEHFGNRGWSWVCLAINRGSLSYTTQLSAKSLTVLYIYSRKLYYSVLCCYARDLSRGNLKLQVLTGFNNMVKEELFTKIHRDIKLHFQF